MGKGDEMSGTKEGGKATAATIKQKYGEDFYANIGSIGGKNGHTGGFHARLDLAVSAGAKGGKISKRGYRYINGEYIKNEA
jgi:hypothetical protein